MPVPVATELAWTCSTPSTYKAAQVPTMSMMASRLPTSWKWTWLGGRRWSLPSASARPSKVASARSRTRSGKRASTIRPVMWAAVRTTVVSSTCTWTLVAAMPQRSTGSASRAQPPTGSSSQMLRISSRSAPASTSAPRAMSPAIPEKQWNQASEPVPPESLTAWRRRRGGGPRRRPRRSRCRCRPRPRPAHRTRAWPAGR